MSLSLEKLLTVDEAADILGVTRRTLERWMAARKVPFVRLAAGTIRFRPCDLARYIDRHVEKAL